MKTWLKCHFELGFEDRTKSRFGFLQRGDQVGSSLHGFFGIAIAMLVRYFLQVEALAILNY